MAKLLFQKNETKTESTLCCAIKHDSGAPCSLELFDVVQISDAEYDSFFDGSKWLRVTNGAISWVDSSFPDQQSKEEFTSYYNLYKNHLKIISTNHPKAEALQNCKNFIDSLDIESLTFPHTDFCKLLRDNNVFVSVCCF